MKKTKDCSINGARNKELSTWKKIQINSTSLHGQILIQMSQGRKCNNKTLKLLGKK